MREFRSSGSVEGVVSNHDPYSDSLRMTVKGLACEVILRDTTLMQHPSLLGAAGAARLRPMAALRIDRFESVALWS
jgi:hypothetical protein